MSAADTQTRSGVVKRSLSIQGHRTSISLEEEFWQVLKAMADERGVSLAALVTEVDQARSRVNLSSALRVHVLRHALSQTQDPSATRAETEPTA